MYIKMYFAVLKEEIQSQSCGVQNRIYHQSRTQTQKTQPEGKQIMQETRSTEFLALFAGPRVGISLSAPETDD